MSYTDEELIAVACVVWPEPGVYMKNCDLFWLNMARNALPPGGNLVNAEGTDDEFLVRLALAHPERAELALGPGWEVSSLGTGWAIRWKDGPYRGVYADRDGSVRVFIAGLAPPEFDAALARARLIAAAWARIENKEV